MSASLRPGWVETSVGEIAASIEYGHTASATESVEGPRFLRITDIQGGKVDWACVPSCSIAEADIAKYRLKSGDIVFARTGATTGKTFLIRHAPLAVYASYLIRLRMCEGVYPPFVQAFFQTSDYWQQIEGGKRGIGQPNVNANILRQLRLPVAPFDEQRRIIAKLEELLSDLDAGVAALERARQNLKRYRAAVLKAAVEGKLTEDWRAAHPVVEPAAKLLERILTERRQRWEEEQLAKFAATGKTPPKNWQTKYIEPHVPHADDSYTFPPTWCRAYVGQIANVVLGKMLDKTKHRTGESMPYVRNINVRWCRVDTDDLLEMYFEKSEIQRFRLLAGDLLVCEGGEPGRAAVWDGRMPNMMFQKALHRVRCLGKTEPQYLVYLLEHLAKSGQLEQYFTGSTIRHFTRESFVEMPIPLPPVDEQVQIVANVEQLLSIAEASESQIEANLHRAARLRQSILKEAFSGRLVPQDPNDEPASVLLERIRQVRDAATPEANGRTRSRSRRKP